MAEYVTLLFSRNLQLGVTTMTKKEAKAMRATLVAMLAELDSVTTVTTGTKSTKGKKKYPAVSAKDKVIRKNAYNKAKAKGGVWATWNTAGLKAIGR